MEPAAPEVDQPPSPPPQPPLRVLHWQALTQAVVEDLGDGARLTMVRIPDGPNADHPGPGAGGGALDAQEGMRWGSGTKLGVGASLHPLFMPPRHPHRRTTAGPSG
jgi:hypothetical protein